jgi:hypothetical protein
MFLLCMSSAIAAMVLLGCGAEGGRGAGNASASSPESLQSGIRGQTLVDAGCTMAYGAKRCPEHPLTARVTVTSNAKNSKVIAAVLSDEHGNFTLPLPPGTYLIEAGSPHGNPVPIAAPRSVTVEAGNYTTVVIHLDSGIR